MVQPPEKHVYIRFAICFILLGLAIYYPVFVVENLIQALTEDLHKNIVAILGTVLACGAFIYTRKQLGESEINNAWGILSRQGGGNMGKTEALETLARHEIPLIGVNVSGPNQNNLAFLQGLNLSKEKHKHQVNCLQMNFSNVYLDHANFKGADLDLANFKGADLGGANFECAEDLRWVTFNNCYVLGHTKEQAMGNLPTFPPNFEVKVGKEIDDGSYYIEIELDN